MDKNQAYFFINTTEDGIRVKPRMATSPSTNFFAQTPPFKQMCFSMILNTITNNNIAWLYDKR